MTNLHLGQNQDITWNRDVMGTDYQYTEDGYITLCRHKTGGLMRVILAWCQTLSAAVVPPEDLASYADLFNGIGVLFQIIDDILNLEDSTVASNKSSPGEDIREGNKTIIVIHALNNGSPDDKSRLKEILLSKTSDQKVIAEAIQICHRTSSMQYAKDFAKRMVKDLKELNHGLLKHKGARSLVEQLIDLIYTRKN